MKKYNKSLGIVALGVAAAALWSCSDTLYDGVEADEVKLSTQRLDLQLYAYGLDGVPYEGGSGRITVYGTGICTLSDFPHWAHAQQTTFGAENEYFSGETQVTVDENTEPRLRTAVISANVSADGISLTQQAEITQYAARMQASFIGTEPVNVSAVEQRIELPYTANVSASEVSAYTVVDWLKVVEVTDRAVVLQCDVNTGSRRETTVRLSPSEVTFSSLTVIQSAPTGGLIGEEHEATVECQGGSVDIHFSSDVPWYSKTSQTWLTVSPESGDGGTHRITLSVSPNLESTDRSATVTLGTSSMTMANYYVRQRGMQISVTPALVTVKSAGGSTATAEVTSNTSWRVSTECDWLSVSPESGNRSGNITVTAAVNESLDKRRGEVFVEATENPTIRKKLTVEQEGQPYGVDNEKLEYGWPGGSRPLAIVTPAEWQCAVSDSWISLSESSGSGNAEINVTCEPNTAEESRSGYVLIHSAGNPISVEIVQQGQYFYIDNKEAKVSAMGGDIALTVHTTVGVSAKIEGDETEWLTFTGPDNTDTYAITAAYNPGIDDREATFVIEPTMDNIKEEYTQGLKYKVIQEGRRLYTSVPKVFVNRSGGQSSTVGITVDGAYEIYKNPLDTWYMLEYDSATDSFYVIATENRTGADRVGKVYLSLKNLPAGQSRQVEVEIVQVTSDFDVTVGGFDKDENWDL